MADRPHRDRAWWEEFEAAPPELRDAMNNTMKARDDLGVLESWNTGGQFELKISAQKKRINDLEMIETIRRNALKRAAATDHPDDPLIEPAADPDRLAKLVECFRCGRAIPSGELYLSLNYHLERVEQGAVTVDQAESMLTTCMDCTPSRKVIAEGLRTAGLPVLPMA
ncbi:MAG TPA: hypothetical protein VGH89_16155 [Pseudonocardia sp.]